MINEHGQCDNDKCHFCDNVATTTRECDDGETHPVCAGCANAWYDEMDTNEHDERTDNGLYETVMAMRDACITNERAYYADNGDAHMERYIINRNARTGQTWSVVERYATNGNGIRCAVDYEFAFYQRAIIANEHDERVRIWYHHSYWRIA